MLLGGTVGLVVGETVGGVVGDIVGGGVVGVGCAQEFSAHNKAPPATPSLLFASNTPISHCTQPQVLSVLLFIAEGITDPESRSTT